MVEKNLAWRHKYHSGLLTEAPNILKKILSMDNNGNKRQDKSKCLPTTQIAIGRHYIYFNSIKSQLKSPYLEITFLATSIWSKINIPISCPIWSNITRLIHCQLCKVFSININDVNVIILFVLFVSRWRFLYWSNYKSSHTLNNSKCFQEVFGKNNVSSIYADEFCFSW